MLGKTQTEVKEKLKRAIENSQALDIYAHITTNAQRRAAQTMGNIPSGTTR